MALKLSNNADGLLAMAISNSATSLTLRAGHGSRFPALGPGDWFPITVVRASDPSQFEIMRCTARSGDTLTVVRAQEGTSAITFNAGDVVSLRLTSGTLEENFPQVEGRNAKNLRFSIDSVGGKPRLKFKSGDGEETVVRQSDIEDVVRRSELGTAATRDVTTSPTDTTPGRVLTVGSLGLGGAAVAVPGNNIDDNTIPTGFYYVTLATSGTKPPGDNGYGYLIVSREGPGVTARQLYLDNDDERIWTRLWKPSQWTTWREVYQSGNIAKLISDANLVQTSRTIYAGTGLTGGGDLSANRSISLAATYIPIGVGQSWWDVSSYRSAGTTYTNTTGRPIMVYVAFDADGTKSIITIGDVQMPISADTDRVYASFIVPAGWTYSVNSIGTRTALTWLELR